MGGGVRGARGRETQEHGGTVGREGVEGQQYGSARRYTHKRTSSSTDPTLPLRAGSPVATPWQ